MSPERLNPIYKKSLNVVLDQLILVMPHNPCCRQFIRIIHGCLQLSVGDLQVGLSACKGGSTWASA